MNGERKIIQAIRIKDIPPTKKNEEEPIQPAQMTTFQCNMYKINSDWPFFNHGLRVQDKQQV